MAPVHAGHQPARVAAADPHEPQHRPRPPRSSARRRRRSLDTEAGDYFLYNKLESQVADENPDEERVLERLSQDSIVDALAEVPHDFRDVIVLVDIGEFSYADAAQILDIPIGTVMSRLHRGQAYPQEESRRRGGADVIDWCEKCEEMMQPFLDGTLSAAEVEEAERHLDSAVGARSGTGSKSVCGTTSAWRRWSRCRPS